MEKIYFFRDLQTSGYSAHQTIDSLTKMLVQDIENLIGSIFEEEGDRKLVDSYFNGEWSKEKKRKYIESHEFKICEPNEDLFYALETNHEEVRLHGWL